MNKDVQALATLQQALYDCQSQARKLRRRKWDEAKGGDSVSKLETPLPILRKQTAIINPLAWRPFERQHLLRPAASWRSSLTGASGWSNHPSSEHLRCPLLQKRASNDDLRSCCCRSGYRRSSTSLGYMHSGPIQWRSPRQTLR